MTHHINLNALRVFAAAGRHGNFQRAADELNLSPGAVSQRIKQLEHDLQVVLFERKARGVSLTPKGAAYHRAVSEALSIVATATSDLTRQRNQITLHLGSSFASRWLMPRMRGFAEAFPNISLATEMREHVLERALGQNEIAIWPGKDAAESSTHEVRCLAPLQLVAVCSPHLMRPDWPLDFEALLSFTLLQDANRRWEQLMEGANVTATPKLLNLDRSALALDAAMKGHGIAIAPTYMIEEDLEAKRLVEIWRPQEPSGEYLFMSWVKHGQRNRPMAQTVRWVLSEFQMDRTT